MPITIPTPDELAAMPWHQQQRARRTVRQLLVALNNEHRCYHGSDGASATTLAQRQEWARQVRREAKRIEAASRVVHDCSPDPHWQEHQAALLEAIR